MRTLQTIYRKVGEHDRGKRVWMQGITLEEAGYAIGIKYSVQYDEKGRTAILTIDDNGENTVSRKKVGDGYTGEVDQRFRFKLINRTGLS